jgi:hypothetical protein
MGDSGVIVLKHYASLSKQITRSYWWIKPLSKGKSHRAKFLVNSPKGYCSAFRPMRFFPRLNPLGQSRNPPLRVIGLFRHVVFSVHDLTGALDP